MFDWFVPHLVVIVYGQNMQYLVWNRKHKGSFNISLCHGLSYSIKFIGDRTKAHTKKAHTDNSTHGLIRTRSNPSRKSRIILSSVLRVINCSKGSLFSSLQ
jgi:hypothetical protein